VTDRAVVFDVDDTLYLERDYVASGFRAVEPLVRMRFGVDGFAAVAWRLFLEGSRGKIFDRALAEMGVAVTSADIADLVTAYREHEPGITLLPDGREALIRLQRMGTPIAVLTDGPQASQWAKVRALGLDRIAEVVILTDRYGPGFGKPNDRGFREIMARIEGAGYVYVADNPAKDFIAPHRLGWRTVRVRRTGGLHECLGHGADVDEEVTDLGQLAW
jgi:putative hydrolase of the HAD superfamily